MELPSVKQRKRGVFALVAVALASLLIDLGIGVGVSAGGRSHIEALCAFGKASAQGLKPITTPQGLPDFVALAKKLKPEVVNISTTQVTKEQHVPLPFGESDPFGEFWKRFFGGPSLETSSSREAWARVSLLTVTV